VILLLFERLAGHCRLVWDTPCYGVPSDMPAFLRDNGIKLSMVWGKADILHTAQTRRLASRLAPASILPARPSVLERLDGASFDLPARPALGAFPEHFPAIFLVCNLRWAAGRRVSQILVPHWEHGLCCTLFDKQLKLHEKVSWWSVE
jgi:hypothetical protein